MQSVPHKSCRLQGRRAALSDPLLRCPARAVLQGVPPGMVFNNIRWSPTGKRFAFTLRSNGQDGDPPRCPLSLFTATPAEMRATPAPAAAALNSIFEDFEWLDDDTLVAAVVPDGRGERPKPPAVPVGPKVSDNADGRTSKARTYPDLLKSGHDGDLFEWLTTSALVVLDAETGLGREVGAPRMYTSCDVSPDGRFMVVAWVERPFSYELPVGRFPRVWQVWDRCETWRAICRL
jgi:hypothetical protein